MKLEIFFVLHYIPSLINFKKIINVVGDEARSPTKYFESSDTSKIVIPRTLCLYDVKLEGYIYNKAIAVGQLNNVFWAGLNYSCKQIGVFSLRN